MLPNSVTKSGRYYQNPEKSVVGRFTHTHIASSPSWYPVFVYSCDCVVMTTTVISSLRLAEHFMYLSTAKKASIISETTTKLFATANKSQSNQGTEHLSSKNSSAL